MASNTRIVVGSGLSVVLAIAMGCNDAPPVSDNTAPPAANADESAEKPADEAPAKKPADEAPAKPAADQPAAGKPGFIGAWKLVGVTISTGPVPKEKLEDGGLEWSFEDGGKMMIKVTAKGQTASSQGTPKLDFERVK